MELFVLEHKKLWRRKSVRYSVLLCLLYIVIFGGFLSYQWFQFGSSNDITSSFGNNFDGYKNIRVKQEYADQWAGNLTDEKLQAMIVDFQSKAENDDIAAYEMTDWSTLNSWVGTLWPELKEQGNPYLMATYVAPSQLTGIYERRLQALEDFLDLNNQTGAEKDYFLKMNSQVNEPFMYDWVQGWSTVVTYTISEMSFVLALFIAIVLSQTFSGEWHDNTKPLILTTEKGWYQLAAAKTGVGLAFSLELFALNALGAIIAQLIFLGTRGWDLPIQCVKLIATAPWNMLQAEIYEYLYLLINSIGFCGVVLLLSSVTRSTFVSLICSLGIVYVPLAISQFLPSWGQKTLELLPFVGDSLDIFRTNVYHLFGGIIWSPYLLISVPLIIGLICMPVGMRCWARRMRS